MSVNYGQFRPVILLIESHFFSTCIFPPIFSFFFPFMYTIPWLFPLRLHFVFLSFSFSFIVASWKREVGSVCLCASLVTQKYYTVYQPIDWSRPADLFEPTEEWRFKSLKWQKTKRKNERSEWKGRLIGQRLAMIKCTR